MPTNKTSNKVETSRKVGGSKALGMPFRRALHSGPAHRISTQGGASYVRGGARIGGSGNVQGGTSHIYQNPKHSELDTGFLGRFPLERKDCLLPGKLLLPFMRCLHLSTGYKPVLLLSSLEEIALLAEVVGVILPDVQHKRGSCCFTTGGKLVLFLPTPGYLCQGRGTHKLIGTQNRAGRRMLPLWFLLFIVVEAVLLADWGVWSS